MFSELKDKVVLITGASGYIGKTIAVEFARHQCRLVLTGRNEEKLRSTASSCEDVGLPDEKLLIVRADLTKESDIERLVQKTEEKYNTIHVLVNAAGMLLIGSSGSITPEDMDRMFATNCRSVFILCQKVVPYLVENGGCIINISSLQRPNPRTILYNMTKACLDQMTKVLALELGPKGVRVNSLNLCPLEGGTLYANCPGGMSKDELQQHTSFLRSAIPLGQLCKVEDVVKAVLFLTSDKAAFISGVLLRVDGGFHNQKLFLPTQFKESD